MVGRKQKETKKKIDMNQSLFKTPASYTGGGKLLKR